MQIENLNEATRTQAFDAHLGMTQAALVQVFGKTESQAATIVRNLRLKFEDKTGTELAAPQ